MSDDGFVINSGSLLSVTRILNVYSPINEIKPLILRRC